MHDRTPDVDSKIGIATEIGDRTDVSRDDTPADAPTSSSSSPMAPSHLSRRTRRRHRVSKWDRPPEPHDWRFFVGHLGRVLITTGLMMFLFVAYQLWGTGIETARAQNKLEDQFQELVAAEAVTDIERPPNVVTDDGVVSDPTSDGVVFRASPLPSQTIEDSGDSSGDEPPPSTTPYETVVPAVEQNLPEYVRGDVLGRIEIPNIGVNFLFVPGVNQEDLKAGVGHFPDTPLPGQLGNSALAGHRTTYKAPFGDLDKVNVGEDIIITMNNDEQYTYVITGIIIVNPADYWVISNSDPNLATLTLITCTPKATSKQRLVVFAELDPTRSGPVGQATIPQLDDPQASVLPDEPPAATTAATTPATTPATTGATTGAAGLATAVPRSTFAATPAPGTAIAGTTDGAVATGRAEASTNFSDAVLANTPPESIAPASTTAPVVSDDSAAPNEGDAFSGSWFDDTAAWPHIAGWGALLSIIAIGAYLISRRTRHDSIGFLAGIVPFTVCLFFFFENVNRLLPPGL